MRSDPADFQLVAPGSLNEALALLASENGGWQPIAGGTDIMVLYAAGRLPRRRLLSLGLLPELRRIDLRPHEVHIGAACTYTDIQRDATLAVDFPLLVQAARWTGSIANQNRGTLGGNIANASPAADSLPALLAYDADLILISLRGERRVPYAGFHTAYKQVALAPDELIATVVLPRRFAGYLTYARKVGARSSQAISKVCMAALARKVGGAVQDVRIALGSVAPVPVRLIQAEEAVNGNVITDSLISAARKTAMKEISPIDDIRSNAKYRAAVAGNLVAEFLRQLTNGGEPGEQVLARWNIQSLEDAVTQILPCGGSTAWARQMAARRPLHDEAALAIVSDDVWRSLPPSDWMEAFRSHTRIGESVSEGASGEVSATWAKHEQSTMSEAESTTKAALAQGNHAYEKKFGYIFIVCATGKSGSEMLDSLIRRLKNDADSELCEAAEQQRQITQLRLRKWLHP
jgi:OHCU decarboxylase